MENINETALRLKCRLVKLVMIKNMAQTDMGALGTLAEDSTWEAVIKKYSKL